MDMWISYIQSQNLQANANIISVISFQTQNGPAVATTGNGAPIGVKTASQTVGRRGPILLQDVNFLDEMTHFDRERIPERVVHAVGEDLIILENLWRTF